MEENHVTEESLEERKIERIEEAYTKVIRKFRKRAEKLGGYETLPDLWQDFAPVILNTIHLRSTPVVVQRLLNYTGDFHDFCEAFVEDTDTHEYKEYFEAMEFAWCSVIKRSTTSTTSGSAEHPSLTETEKVRILNVLQDGQERASNKLGISQAYSKAIDLIDDDL
ncbi:hypothetical protein BDF20DRAFT_864999 [Mycotypha africana]|uniref:uncharacterized protein n=1 Tax=Mycotypha africana TaxID=64632 RepID=UPI002300D8AB|nr:uncharacterized protein BDF20DRAFT_864999 [Mycotypha africana]KAI8982108.1 hypothetical protein BDF20DRAFT_864999 [Mycotypha africana]